ncbi:U4/U6 small nuclear ribonucleoprotein Prp3-like, partial [Trifolium medium]|nr:U4/U6 small nuclear ribonucleoprotein Prp3-like [Trifolium medium]
MGLASAVEAELWKELMRLARAEVKLQMHLRSPCAIAAFSTRWVSLNYLILKVGASNKGVTIHITQSLWENSSPSDLTSYMFNSFIRFSVHDCITEAAARKVFMDAGVPHYWDQAVNYED